MNTDLPCCLTCTHSKCPKVTRNGRNISPEPWDWDTQKHLLEQKDAETAIDPYKNVRGLVVGLFHPQPTSPLTWSSVTMTTWMGSLSSWSLQAWTDRWGDTSDLILRRSCMLQHWKKKQNQIRADSQPQSVTIQRTSLFFNRLVPLARIHLFHWEINCHSDTLKYRKPIMGPLCNVKHADCINWLW